jgi:hypothetical protein
MDCNLTILYEANQILIHFENFKAILQDFFSFIAYVATKEYFFK